jgi:hypothetical protein
LVCKWLRFEEAGSANISPLDVANAAQFTAEVLSPCKAINLFNSKYQQLLVARITCSMDYTLYYLATEWPLRCVRSKGAAQTLCVLLQADREQLI